MGKTENSVGQAVEQVCAIYHIPLFREQSRVLKVENRLIFYGSWKDDLGILHSAGKSDYLAFPIIRTDTPVGEMGFAVPLWIETKSGLQRKSRAKCICKNYDLDHQEHFRQYVTSHNHFHLVCRDSAEALVEWLKEQYVIQ